MIALRLAKELNVRVSDIVIGEAMAANKMNREEVTSSVMATFCHNLYAMEMGLTSGKSFLMGTNRQDLADEEVTIIGDKFVNKILKYTLAAQVGNHVVGAYALCRNWEIPALTPAWSKRYWIRWKISRKWLG